MRTARLLHGHVLDALRSLPDESVHCVVTSPPYWGLRDYGLEPQVWGGDPRCLHEWGAVLPPAKPGPGNKPESAARSSTLTNPGYHAEKPNKPPDGGAFCSCGAWRGSLGLEPTVDLFVAHMVEVFEEVRRVLRSDGSLWLNLGDCYAGSWGARGRSSTPLDSLQAGRELEDCPQRHARASGLKPKDLVGMPWRVAFALQAAGWWLRSDCVWSKPNPMPESVTDRPTRAHEFVFLLTKSARYYYDQDAVRTPLSKAVQARPYKQIFNSERQDVGMPGASPGRRGSVRKADVLEGAQRPAGNAS